MIKKLNLTEFTIEELEAKKTKIQNQNFLLEKLTKQSWGVVLVEIILFILSILIVSVFSGTAIVPILNSAVLPFIATLLGTVGVAMGIGTIYCKKDNRLNKISRMILDKKQKQELEKLKSTDLGINPEVAEKIHYCKNLTVYEKACELSNLGLCICGKQKCDKYCGNCRLCTYATLLEQGNSQKGHRPIDLGCNVDLDKVRRIDRGCHY